MYVLPTVLVIKLIMMEKNEQSIAEVMKDLYRKSYREAAKVIVAGGRDFTDYEFMRESLGNLLWMEDFCGDSDIKIISGMADGADTLAKIGRAHV